MSIRNDYNVSSVVIQSKQWTHLVWRYRADVGEMAVFVNGIEAASQTGHSNFLGR